MRTNNPLDMSFYPFVYDTACEDDVESRCPYVGMMPDESENENGSPLNFIPGYIRIGDDQEPDTDMETLSDELAFNGMLLNIHEDD